MERSHFAPTTFRFAQITALKIIDTGSSGPYKAIAATEATLPDYVVYRPMDLDAACDAEGKLPVIVFGNGGCSDSSLAHERVLSEIASHGYLIIAIGALELVPGRERAHTPASRLLDAIGWITAQAADQASECFERVNTNRIAAMGQSCGGAQVVYAAADPRVTTSILFNAGMGELTMAGADKESLRALHGPIVYIVGGPTDIAYVNAELDYARIDHVPVAFTSLVQGGHMGTFAEEFGGSFARVARDWLDWQLKGRADHAAVFVAGDLTGYPGWTAKARNFERLSA